MDDQHYEELKANLDRLIQQNRLQKKKLYLFGHCNAAEELADLLYARGFSVEAFLDNNREKQGNIYHGLPVLRPECLLNEPPEQCLVLVAARAYASIVEQLERAGFHGQVQQMVLYNSYSEYSLSENTIFRKTKRVSDGMKTLSRMIQRYPDAYKVFCPFAALGDVYFMMSYLPYFLRKKGMGRYVVFVIGKACADVARMFGTGQVESVSQKEMDEMIQAVLYTEEKQCFIPHQDRPYVVNLAKALYLKKIPLEKLYCCGVFGLKAETVPVQAQKHTLYLALCKIQKAKSIVLAPYAKSVTNISFQYWEQIVQFYTRQGYQIFTNTAGNEEPLPGTVRLEAALSEMRSVVEHAGTFIGLRSGLCDVIRDARCKKIALYPDCYYSGTKWKMEEIYHLEGWENIVVPEEGRR